jgi:formamidopyrimidine-DNA glycosylase
MPELPEVETYREELEPRLVGRAIEGAVIADARLTAPRNPREVATELKGQRIAAVQRRGKYLILRFGSGQALVVHLRMTGGFLMEMGSHVRAVLVLDDGTRVIYRDVRRFGTWHLLEPDNLDAYLSSRLGPEPLGKGFTTSFLALRLASRRAPIKAALLDQRTVAGLGNIYADEALWHARVHPLRPAGELTANEVAALRRGIRSALRRGIERQGSNLGDGAYARGSMQDEFKVYGRAGEPCPRCGTTIERTRAGGRGTAFCPRCQT